MARSAKKETGKHAKAAPGPSGITTALTASGKAFAQGLLDAGMLLGGFGLEILGDAKRHVVATVHAGSAREAAEMQAAFLQDRLELSTAYAKELADLAWARSELVIAPIVSITVAPAKS